MGYFRAANWTESAKWKLRETSIRSATCRTCPGGDVPPLWKARVSARDVHLTALDQRSISGSLPDSGTQSRRPVQHVQPGDLEIEATLLHLGAEFSHHGGVLAGALP